MRLCDRGVLEAAWEENPPLGRPPRHLYCLKGGVAPAPRPEPGMDPYVAELLLGVAHTSAGLAVSVPGRRRAAA